MARSTNELRILRDRLIDRGWQQFVILISDKETQPMDSNEIHAKAVIAAALIASRAVELPRIPTSGEMDTAALRLRELTNYVYRTIANN